jgi:2-dehydro-3-deoxygluconokinase
VKYDIVGIGEALVEFAEVEPNRYVQSFAGDVLNTLYYASRLGLKTTFFSTIGADTFGSDLEASLLEHHIASSELLHSTKPNGLYIIRTSAEGEPQFTFHRSDSAARTTFESCTDSQIHDVLTMAPAIIVSAIGLAIFRNVERLVVALETMQPKPVVYFDSNVRAALWPDLEILRCWVVHLAPIVDILSVSVADDRQLFGPRTHKEMLAYYSDLGYSNIVLRDGPNHIHLRFDGTESVVATHTVLQPVDTTGAGDAYNAAFLYGWLRGLDATICSALGSASAAQVIQHRGGLVREFDPKPILSML